MNLFIVGKSTRADSGWDFAGVFDERQKAIDACIDASYFVGPAVLNENVPEEETEWPGALYPRAERQSWS